MGDMTLPAGRLRRARTGAMLFLLTVVVRLVYVSVVPADVTEFPLRIDYWADIAHELARGHGYSLPGPEGPRPTASRVPLYPLLLSTVYALSGGSDRAGLVLQSLLDGCSALLLLRLGRAIGRPRAGVVAAVGWALYLPQWRMSQRLWAEPFTTVIGLLLLLAAERARSAPSRRSVLRVGILAGALALSRPVGGVGSVAVLAWLAARSRPVRQGLAWALLGFALVMLPWIGRNAVRMGAFIPLDTTGGFNLYVGTLGARYYVPMSQFDPQVRALVQGSSEVQTDRTLRGAAVQRVLADPAGHVRRMGRKVALFFFGFRDPERDRFPTAQTLLAGAALYGLALVGWWRLRRQGMALADLLLVLPVLLALVHAQIISQMRMMLPVLPCLLLLAGEGALHAADAVRAVTPLWRARR